jgi:hypothetical protein
VLIGIALLTIGSAAVVATRRRGRVGPGRSS